jgi:mannose-1-phosphate guanylyltransferase
VSTWVVILAGGVGSRFWPLSTPARPKQLLPLASERPLLFDTVERLRPLADASHMLILTNASLVDSIIELVPDLPRTHIIAEPKPAGTAAALTWAAQEITRRDGPGAVMVSVHADWAIADDEGFRRTLQRAVTVAEQQHALVTVGVVPSRPDPGFGYIQPGAEIADGVRRVARFVEKPDRVRAAAMMDAGDLWNSGIFVWRTGDFLDAVRRLTPEIAPALHAHADDVRAFFASVTPVSVDVGVLERSQRVLVLAGDFGWDDVGAWGALRRVRAADASGNAVYGDVYAVDAHANVVHSDGPSVVLYGVDDLVVVVRDGLVLVTTTDRSSDLKALIDTLPRHVVDRV